MQQGLEQAGGWETALEHGFLSIWHYDVPRDEGYTSTYWWKMLGRTPPRDGRHTKSEWLELVHPDDRQRMAGELARFLESEEEIFESEYRALHLNGTGIWVSERGRKLCENGVPRRVVGTIVDISRTKQVEAESFVGRELHRLFTETSGDIVAVMGGDGRFEYISPSIRSILGYEPEQMIGQDSYLFLSDRSAADMSEARERRDEAAQIDVAGTNRTLEVRRRDGSTVWLDTSYSYLRDARNQVTKIIAFARDATARVMAEQALARNERHFRSIFDQMAIGLMETNVVGQIRRANQRVAEILGYTRQELCGMTFGELTHEDDLQMSLEARDQMMAGEIATFAAEKRYVRKDGTPVWCMIRASLVRDESGRPEFAITTVEDITDRRELQARLEQNREELERRVQERTAELSRANEELRCEIEERRRVERRLQESEKLAATARLAAGVAHEINNPLAGIKNAFELVKDLVPKDHQYSHYVGRIEAEIRRVADIVREMHGLYQPCPEADREFDLVHSVHDSVQLLEADGSRKQIVWSLPNAGSPEIVHLDEGWTRRILVNLLRNAIDASPEGGEIEIQLISAGERVVLIIRDHGPGIPEEFRSKVFEPFFTSKHRREARGMGLGLSISRSLVDAMDGTLSLDPAPGGGTCATVNLPRLWTSLPIAGTPLLGLDGS
ncbi:MAG: PAS domain S-box protein [Candidatus Eisenbacteria bacterium]|nr:PAS domain S-box protein [Candidatus Eisenbacteria bacterium]